jgi:hypothetical protein
MPMTGSSRVVMRGVAVVVAVGCALLVGASAWFDLRAQAFLSRGVEQEVRVAALDRVLTQYRAGATYRYLLQADGKSFTSDFRIRLPVGTTLSVLVLPEGGPESVVPGRRSDGWFAIRRALAGGTMMSILSLALALGALLVGPWIVVQLWRMQRP